MASAFFLSHSDWIDEQIHEMQEIKYTLFKFKNLYKQYNFQLPPEFKFGLIYALQYDPRFDDLMQKMIDQFPDEVILSNFPEINVRVLPDPIVDASPIENDVVDLTGCQVDQTQTDRPKEQENTSIEEQNENLTCITILSNDETVIEQVHKTDSPWTNVIKNFSNDNPLSNQPIQSIQCCIEQPIVEVDDNPLNTAMIVDRPTRSFKGKWVDNLKLQCDYNYDVVLDPKNDLLNQETRRLSNVRKWTKHRNKIRSSILSFRVLRDRNI